MSEKRYYWLKLQHDFFQSVRIKKLRKLAGGDTYTIIYLKLQLKSISNGGCLEYTGLEPTFAEEIALDIDESPDDVAITVQYLLSTGLLETTDDRTYKVPYAILNTGKETADAQRKREAREVKKLEAADNVRTLSGNCPTEKEKEIDKEKDVEIETDKKKRFTPPSVEEVRAYCQERKNGVDPEAFVDYYSSQKWKKANGRPVEDWQACVRTWEKKDGRGPKVITPVVLETGETDRLLRLIQKME